MAVFGRKSYLPASLIDPILKNKACCSILIKESSYHPDRVSDGSAVNNLLKLWVCKLSFLKRHPSIQKSKIMKQRALIAVKGIFGKLLYQPASLISLLRDEENSEWKPKYGIELPTSIRIIWVEAVENLGNFKHINSLLGKRHMIRYLQKNMSKIPVDNGSSLNKLIRLKIIALTNVTLIETSVLVVYP
jgi:hypothetical protein